MLTLATAARLLAAAVRRPTDAQREIDQLLREWQRGDAPLRVMGEPLLAAMSAGCDGWIVRLAGPDARLVVSIDGAPPTTDPIAVADALHRVRDGLAHLRRGPSRLPPDSAHRLQAITDWLRHDRARHLAVTHRPHAARRHRKALNTAVLALAAAPAHEQCRRATESSAVYAALATDRHHHSIARSTASVIILLSRDD